MTRKKKIIVGSLIAFLVLVAIAYVVANVALDRVSRRLMAELAAKAVNRGIGVSQPSFASARLSFLLSPSWYDLRATVAGRGPDWDLQVEQATLVWGFGNRADLIARGVTLVESSEVPQERNVSGRKIAIDRVTYQVPFDLLNPKSMIPSVLEECERLISEGSTSWPLSIEGKIDFQLKNKPVELRSKIVRHKEEYVLALDEEDVAALSELFEDKLTEAEVELIASNPFRAARLLQIKDTAESTSARASQKDPSVPQDAYRHVLWSYLLTQAYDAEFAEQVGVAHETGDTGNTEAERQMDLHNNAIGRNYAEQGMKQTALLKHLLGDAEVRHTP